MPDDLGDICFLISRSPADRQQETYYTTSQLMSSIAFLELPVIWIPALGY